MSGGSFDYAYCVVQRFADDLALRLDEFDKTDDCGDQQNLIEPATLAKLMKEAEWLYSGDIGDDSFMARVAKIEGSTHRLADGAAVRAGQIDRLVIPANDAK